MGEEIVITDKPVRVTAATKQDLRLCFDASPFDYVQLELIVSEGTSVAVKMTTNMQNESENGWLDVAIFSPATAPSVSLQRFANLLRYLRWEVTSSGNATFVIRGVGRSWAAG
jgi:hypothetical protein